MLNLTRREFGATVAARQLLLRSRSSLAERLGVSTGSFAGFDLRGSVQAAYSLGFTTFELLAFEGARHSVGPAPGHTLRGGSAEQQRLRNLTRPFRHVSAHMPFHGLQLLSTNATVRQLALDQIRSAMRGLAKIDGKTAVMHAGNPPPGLNYRDTWQNMVKMFRALGDEARRLGLRIGLETMQPDSVADYCGLIGDIDHDHVGATIDTGHIRGARELRGVSKGSPEAVSRYNDVLHEIIDTLGHKVFHYHLADVRAGDWMDHRQPGTGIVDFSRLMSKLKQRSFSGLLVFELEEPDVLAALQQSRKYVLNLIESA